MTNLANSLLRRKTSPEYSHRCGATLEDRPTHYLPRPMELPPPMCLAPLAELVGGGGCLPPPKKTSVFCPQSYKQGFLFDRRKNTHGICLVALFWLIVFFHSSKIPKYLIFKKNFPTFMAKKLFAKKKQFYSKKTCLKPFSKKTLANSDHRGEVNAHRVA